MTDHPTFRPNTKHLVSWEKWFPLLGEQLRAIWEKYAPLLESYHHHHQLIIIVSLIFTTTPPSSQSSPSAALSLPQMMMIMMIMPVGLWLLWIMTGHVVYSWLLLLSSFLLPTNRHLCHNLCIFQFIIIVTVFICIVVGSENSSSQFITQVVIVFQLQSKIQIQFIRHQAISKEQNISLINLNVTLKTEHYQKVQSRNVRHFKYCYSWIYDQTQGNPLKSLSQWHEPTLLGFVVFKDRPSVVVLLDYVSSSSYDYVEGLRW